MPKIIPFSQLKSITNKIKKEFGYIPKGQENNYASILYTFEANLLNKHRTTRIPSRRALDSVYMCLWVIEGYLRDEEFDFQHLLTPETEVYLNTLLQTFDPFTREEVREVLEKSYDLTNKESLKRLLTPFAQSLNRLADSIELWNKKQGTNGYFRFLENNIGGAVKHEDQIHFLAEIPKDKLEQIQ